MTFQEFAPRAEPPAAFAPGELDMLTRLVAALLAVAFMTLVLAAGGDPRPRRRRRLALTACAVGLVIFVPAVLFLP